LPRHSLISHLAFYCFTLGACPQINHSPTPRDKRHVVTCCSTRPFRRRPNQKTRREKPYNEPMSALPVLEADSYRYYDLPLHVCSLRSKLGRAARVRSKWQDTTICVAAPIFSRWAEPLLEDNAPLAKHRSIRWSHAFGPGPVPP